MDDLTTKLQVAQELVAQATEKREANPDYHPTMAEIKAVDLVLVEQARKIIEQAAQEAFVEAHNGL